MMSLFEEMLADQDDAWPYGPPAPFQMPKFTRARDRAAVREMLDAELADEIAARTEAATEKTQAEPHVLTLR